MTYGVVRNRLLASTIIAGALIAAAPAIAQNAQPPAGDVTPSSDETGGAVGAPADRGEIVVTGSRLARPDLQSSTPVAIINAAAIQQTGVTNVQDALAQLPSVGQNFSRTSSNFSTTGNGEATVNLRNLGSSRTLVLINGRRSVGIAGTSSVDVNNIPTDFVDRIETVTGGASAVYGSEAIAGVVNFVLKDRFEGIQVRGQSNISGQGDSPHQYFSVTAGQSFAGDRGHIIFNGSYDNDHGLRSRNRAYSANDNPNRSSYAAQGLFSLDDRYSAANGNTYTFTPLNQVKQYQGANIDGYNRNNDRYLSVPVLRYSANALGNFELNDKLTVYAEGEFTKTKSNAGLEPSAISNEGPGAAQNFDGSPLAGVPITNAFIPDTIRNAAIAAGVTAIPFRRRSNDIFSRSNRDEREYYRGVGGIKGDITSDVHFDVYYEHSQTHDFTTSQSIFAPNYGAALDTAVVNGQVVCANPAARAAGCAPLNIFGYNTVSAAASKWLQTDPGAAFGGLQAGNNVAFQYDAHTKQDVVSGTLNGSLFKLPGGPLSFAVGGEYRREKSSEVFDPYTQAGLTVGNQLSNTVGKFDVKEGFVELNAPLLADRPFVHYLGLEGAARYADYSTIGGVWSWKAGGDFAPTADIRFRGVYAVATRAPNISELFSAQSQTFPAVQDPCDQRQGGGDGAPITQALSSACRAIPGVAATAAREGSFAYTTAQIQTIDGLEGGNRNLKQETAHTITAGAVFTPQFARNFSLTVDYYRIKVKNAVGIIGQQVSASQCLVSGDPLFCNNVIRNAQGFITRVNAINLNTGSYLVSGLDIQGRYRQDLSRFNVPGVLDFSVFWNHLFKQQQTPFPGGPVQDELGQADCYSCGRLGTGFKNKITGNVEYTINGVSLNYRVNYLGPVADNLDPEIFTRRIPAYIYHNVQARFNVGKDRRISFYTGVNNLTDKQPPVFQDTNPVTWPGTQTVADTYDLYGRMFYAGFEVKF